MTALQFSLLDVDTDIEPRPLDLVRRTRLSDGAWIDLCPGWMSGADELFDRLAHRVSWHAEQRQMYERVVSVPRLLSFYGEQDVLPDPALDDAKRLLDAHYAPELGGSRSGLPDCASTGMGATAWHGTATRSAAAGPRTRWWRSSPSVHRGPFCYGRAAAAGPCGTTSATAI
jgi:hypothetical protein